MAEETTTKIEGVDNTTPKDLKVAEDGSESKPGYIQKLDEMKAENIRMEKNIAEIKELKAIDALSGKIDSGSTGEAKPVEETPKDYANKILGNKTDG